MTTQEECDYADKLNAARAMLAALKEINVRYPLSPSDRGMLLAAIAQAEAAGIKAEG